MVEKPFYAEGLRFTCTRCSDCCCHESGYVFLTEEDASMLVSMLRMRYTDFLDTYCRWIPLAWGIEQLALREKSNYDCIFWKQGCSVYEQRPRQCRAFPFWHSVVASVEAWTAAARTCPGMGSGVLHSNDEITSWLAREDAETVICKKSSAELSLSTKTKAPQPGEW
ncbi:MAG: YkgJ family cysteine cluster protein [Treponema sp.]|jgi:Fe-S-cluster containining protein|nr:YkgJ family cysteine cluster protein [Treponema sp.]